MNEGLTAKEMTELKYTFKPPHTKDSIKYQIERLRQKIYYHKTKIDVCEMKKQYFIFVLKDLFNVDYKLKHKTKTYK